jgi:hypothetical protein
MRVTLYKVDKKIDSLIQDMGFIKTGQAEQKETVKGLTSALQACTVEIALIKQAQAGHSLNFKRGWGTVFLLITVGINGLLSWLLGVLKN